MSLAHLPNELLYKIGLNLNGHELGKFCQITQITATICRNTLFWRDKIAYDFNLGWNANVSEDPQQIYRQLVTAQKRLLAKGELVTPETLLYISISLRLTHLFTFLIQTINLSKYAVYALKLTIIRMRSTMFQRIFKGTKLQLTKKDYELLISMTIQEVNYPILIYVLDRVDFTTETYRRISREIDSNDLDLIPQWNALDKALYKLYNAGDDDIPSDALDLNIFDVRLSTRGKKRYDSAEKEFNPFL